MFNLSDYASNGDKWLYHLLANEKQDTFPDNYRLNFLYESDHYNSDTSAGVAILKLQEYLALLDIPNFFITIHTSNKNMRAELNLAKKEFAPQENDIGIVQINGEFSRILTNKNSLCIYPWIHFYINPQGLVGTCCEFNENFPIGHVNDGNLSEIANNKKMRTVRMQMLANQRPEICSNCWKKEDNGIRSSRQSVNSTHSKYLNLTKDTLEDGTVNNFKLRHLDFRASNICNLKCRMCSGKFSSRIAQEESDLYNFNQFIELKLDPSEISNTMSFIEEEINNLDSIYFAGGEPLIMDEHYQILDLLIKHQRTDIDISYNTNLTKLQYKNKKVIDYWKQFSNVSVGASIDLIGAPAEYVRSGCSYPEIESNYHAIKDHVRFAITSTVSIFNAFNLPDLQKHWINNLGVDAKRIMLNILVNPSHQSLQVLPRSFKDLAVEKINTHIKWLSTVSGTDKLILSWQDVLKYINADDQSHLLTEFFRLNDDKDCCRKEKFENVFPEYAGLRQCQ